MRERLGPAAELGVVPFDVAAAFQVAHLALGSTWRLADTAHADAVGFGVTRELGSGTPYTISQAWAVAFDGHFGGICYQSRFTTGRDQHAVALFGPSGERDWPMNAITPGVAACAQSGLEIMSSAPRFDRLDIVHPAQTPPTRDHL